MNYKIYYKGDKVKAICKGDICLTKEEKDILNFSINGNTLSYSILNPSKRTTYLLNQNLLHLGVFVNENKKRYAGKGCRSEQSIKNHPHRKFWRDWRITSLNGTINMEWFTASVTLSFIFDKSAEYEDPYRENGYDDFYIGIGRNTDSLRPYSMSEAYRIWKDNPN